MNLAVVVILVLSVVILADLCTAAYLYGYGTDASKRCQYQFMEHATNIESCEEGWYKNRCKVKVCFKNLDDSCGNQNEPDLQLKYGLCAPNLKCCFNKCQYHNRCQLPTSGLTDVLDMIMNVKRKSVASKTSMGQFDEAEEY